MDEHNQGEVVASYSVNIVKTVGLGMVFMSLFVVSLIVAVMGGIGYVVYSAAAQPRAITQFTSPGELKLPLPDLGQYLIMGDAAAWKECSVAGAAGSMPVTLSPGELKEAGGLGLNVGSVVGGFKVIAAGEYVIKCKGAEGAAPAAFTLAIKPDAGPLAGILQSIGLSAAISIGFSMVIGLSVIAALVLFFFLFRRNLAGAARINRGFGGGDDHGTI